MAEKDPARVDSMDPDKLKGPGGLTLRQVHEQVRKSVERDREAQDTQQDNRERGLLARLMDRLRLLLTGRKR